MKRTPKEILLADFVRLCRNESVCLEIIDFVARQAVVSRTYGKRTEHLKARIKTVAGTRVKKLEFRPPFEFKRKLTKPKPVW